MSQPTETPDPSLPRVNVLILDGGGVRGISALVILQALMHAINVAVQDAGYTGAELRPCQLFKLVSGTSTGGLISIMLGKLGMTAEQCIEQYRTLARTIFSSKKWHKKTVGGLTGPRYKAKTLAMCVRKLLNDRGVDTDMPMICGNPADRTRCTSCAVVCRERENGSPRSDLKPGAAFICSISCSQSIPCSIVEAARATTAARTYFKHQTVKVDKLDRFFEDGGFKYNNPSYETYHHYHLQAVEEALKERRRSQQQRPVESQHLHPGLDLRNARFINIGTGTRASGEPDRKREKLRDLFTPSILLNAGYHKHSLIKGVTDPEETAGFMRTLASLSFNTMEYERFSATGGVHLVKLDAYRELEDMERRTRDFLEQDDVGPRLRAVAVKIARDFLRAA